MVDDTAHRYKQPAAFCGDKRIVLQIPELSQFAHQFPYRSGLPETFLPLHSSALLSLCTPPFHWQSLAFSLTPRFASVVEIQPRLSSKVKEFEGELSESSKRRHGFTACYHKEKAMRNMYRMVTSYQKSRFWPPNNPNFDTKLGLLLFVRKGTYYRLSQYVPCKPGSFSSSFFLIFPSGKVIFTRNTQKPLSSITFCYLSDKVLHSVYGPFPGKNME